MDKNRQLPSWWKELRSLYKEFTDGLTNDIVQQIARKQVVAFRLPTVQEEVAGWWVAPLSSCSLGQQDFLPHCDFCGMKGFEGDPEGRNPGTGQGSAVLCGELRDTFWGPMQCGKGSPEVYGAPHAPQR